MHATRRVGLAILFLIQFYSGANAQSGIITTYVGPGLPVNGAVATTQSLDGPIGVAADGAGGFYVTSRLQNRVYRVAADGGLTCVAGSGTYGFGGDGGPATSARFAGPTGIAVDSAGNLFISDSGNNRIRKITPGGAVSTVAGDGISGFGGDRGPATSAELNNPGGVAMDTAGNLYIADSGNHRIRKVTAAGVISTVAGIGIPGFSGDGGPATSAQLNYPAGLAVDAAGSLFICDPWNNRIRRVTTEGAIDTVAGNGAAGFSGDGGQATSAPLNYPYTIAVDATGNLYIGEFNNRRVRKVTKEGVISTVAGNGGDGFSGDGGPATSAQISMAGDVAVDAAGNLYIGDYGNNRVRKVTPGGVINTVAGNGTSGFSGDGGAATAAQLNRPYGIALDTAGSLYIADYYNDRVRKVLSGGIISTVAGNGILGFSGDGGSATAAQLNTPSSVAADSSGNLYIADDYNSRIRKITVSGIISTVAGNGDWGFSGDGEQSTAAQLNVPEGVAVDSTGNVYIADTGNNRIRKVTPGVSTPFGSTSLITTVAGNGTNGFGGDGGPATAAQLSAPNWVAVDSARNLYIADSHNYRIRKVTPAGVISTVAGNGTKGFSGDGGPATSAQLGQPEGMAVDSAGNLYFADSSNNRIRKVTPAGVISTVAGNGAAGFSGDGGLALTAQLNGPTGVAVDSAGNLYIADSDNNRIRKVSFQASIETFFPQVAIGGGYSTLFTLNNTEATPVSANLVLTDQQGNPLTVNAILTDSSGVAGPSSPGSAFPMTIPSGGTIFLSTLGLTASSPLTVGWARLESTGGSLTGVATYEYAPAGSLLSMVGVLQVRPLEHATIPVDNDDSQGKQMAYAIANPGSQTISVKLALMGQDGTVVDDTIVVTLRAGEQIARYLYQDLARTKFKGSLVLRGQGGATFIAVALLDKQGLLTVIPLTSGKAPGVPD